MAGISMRHARNITTTPVKLGPEIGAVLKGAHEKNGVVFHLGDGVAAIEDDGVVLTGGARLPADWPSPPPQCSSRSRGSPALCRV